METGLTVQELADRIGEERLGWKTLGAIERRRADDPAQRAAGDRRGAGAAAPVLEPRPIPLSCPTGGPATAHHTRSGTAVPDPRLRSKTADVDARCRSRT